MTVLFCFKLASAVDSRLRTHLGRRGQLVTLIVLILNTIDLMTVPILESRPHVEDLIATTVKLPPALHGDLKRIASLRGSSMTALMNSAVWSYTEEMSKKDATTALKAAHRQLDNIRHV
jgi:predicted transcriptional regulator